MAVGMMNFSDGGFGGSGWLYEESISALELSNICKPLTPWLAQSWPGRRVDSLITPSVDELWKDQGCWGEFWARVKKVHFAWCRNYRFRCQLCLSSNLIHFGRIYEQMMCFWFIHLWCVGKSQATILKTVRFVTYWFNLFSVLSWSLCYSWLTAITPHIHSGTHIHMHSCLCPVSSLVQHSKLPQT